MRPSRTKSAANFNPSGLEGASNWFLSHGIWWYARLVISFPVAASNWAHWEGGNGSTFSQTGIKDFI